MGMERHFWLNLDFVRTVAHSEDTDSIIRDLGTAESISPGVRSNYDLWHPLRLTCIVYRQISHPYRNGVMAQPAPMFQ